MARPRRAPGFNYIGMHRYSLTLCVQRRRPLLEDRQLARAVAFELLAAANLHQFELSAYCLMPDHLHVLCVGQTEAADLRRFMALTKQRSGWRCNPLHKPLWQPGYFDRVLRDDEESLGVIRYIVNNPVRAGLVSRPEDYEFWGSSTHSRDEVLDYLHLA